MFRTFILFLSLAALPACLKAPPPVAAAAPAPAALAALRAMPDSAEVVAAPPRLIEGLAEELQMRNLQATIQDDISPFGGGKGTVARLESLGTAHRGAAWWVLVETDASYFAQVAGQYRWIVRAHLSVVPSAAPAEGTGLEVEIPVFLQFSHEKGDAALAAATPALRRRLGELLDEAIASQSAP